MKTRRNILLNKSQVQPNTADPPIIKGCSVRGHFPSQIQHCSSWMVCGEAKCVATHFLYVVGHEGHKFVVLRQFFVASGLVISSRQNS